MTTDFDSRLRAYAEVLVRIGLNLQRRQRLLIAEPYELQGVARSASALVEAVRAVAGCEVEVIWGDGARLREYALSRDWRGFAKLVGAHARLMDSYIRQGDALLFLQGLQANLMTGVLAASIAESRRISWEHFGPIAQQLISGATNWAVAPAPGPDWAELVYADLPAAQRLPALWDEVCAALRIPGSSGTGPAAASDGAGPDGAVAAWQGHLRALQNSCDELNVRRVRSLHFLGEGTDLTVGLADEHVWCTACLKTEFGLPFVANLPTEEVFTAPLRDSATGTVRVARPVNYGGAVIDGIQLEFRHGRVVRAEARTGYELLRQLLDTDEGACRLGEVALVPHETSLARSTRLFRHPLLDENCANHIALGEAYPFCLRPPNPSLLNRSLVHVDLPLAARVVLAGAELA